MKRQLRRSYRKIERSFSQAKSFATSFGRSNSAYAYSFSTTDASSTITSSITDSDEDLEFRPTTPIESAMDDAGDTLNTLIPCEFCNLQVSSTTIIQHQITCPQNPSYTRRRNLTPTNATHGRRRRVVSDSVSPVPSAPPRTRSPSPTEGFPVPNHLQCPITRVLFRDPVVASDGHTYERDFVTRWLQKEKISPMTREPISVDKLHPNRIVKDMVNDFRAECKRKKLLYKYQLDVDLKKTEQIPYVRTNTKSIYRAEWMKTNLSSTNSNIILIHLTAGNAEKLAEMNCRLGPHPNIVRVLGRVNHDDTGILLVQELPSANTLSQFLKDTEQKLSITILDRILYEIASALQHLTIAEVIHGNITTDNILVYPADEISENILVKLTNIGDLDGIDTTKIAPEVLSKNLHSEKSDVYAFGVLAREIYSLKFDIDDKDLTERQVLSEQCLATDPTERPTFDELTKTLHDLINE